MCFCIRWGCMGMKRSHAAQWAASTFLMKCSIPRSTHKYAIFAISDHLNPLSYTQLLLLLLTPGEVLLSVHLADGSTVVFQLANPLLRLFELVLQILL